MIVVIQRVSSASVSIGGNLKDEIGRGLLLLLGIEESDNQDDIVWLVEKICKMRIFADKDGMMNVSIADIEGEVLLISQFMLHASTRKGNRPSYSKAAKPAIAEPLYEEFINKIELVLGKRISTGVFGANMQVSLVNDGPVTIIVDSKNRKY